MKDHIILLFLSLMAFLSGCTTQEYNSPVIISGQVQNSDSTKIFLLNYSGDTIASVIPEQEGVFQFELDISEEGFYELKHGIEFGSHASLFIRPGDSITLTYDASNFNQTLLFGGDGADPNNFLALESKRENNWYKDFYNEVSESDRDKKGSIQIYYISNYIADLKVDLSRVVTDTAFQTLMRKELDFEASAYVLLDRLAYQSDPKLDPILSQELKKALSISIDDQNLLNSSKPYLSLVALRLMAQEHLTEDQLANTYDQISSTGLKDYFVSKLELALRKQLQYGEDDFNKAEVFNSFLDRQKMEVGETTLMLYEKFHEVEGKTANFKYLDNNGKLIDLEQFRGSYVYIDFWATWCRPCIKEIPDLVKLKEVYSDKGIEFIGISIDDVSREERWKNMILEYNLSGTQLHAPMNGYIDKDKTVEDDFLELLYVNSYYLGIPHFALIDPEGKILDAFTYRPSNSKLPLLFDNLLANK